MLAAILGPDAVDRELLELMLERSEGNPFVLEEMLRELVESSGLGTGWTGVARRNPLPESVTQAILLACSGSGDERSAVLETAATLGRSFDARDAARGLGRARGRGPRCARGRDRRSS